MIRRLAILTGVVALGFLAIAAWGFFALSKWQAGLAGERLGRFAQVAEAVGMDVKQQLDEFLAREQQRPYTDYLYFHVSGQQQALPVRSSLGGSLDHGLAYGHFQIEPDGTVLTPNDNIVRNEGETESNRLIEQAGAELRERVQRKLLPRIEAETTRQDAFKRSGVPGDQAAMTQKGTAAYGTPSKPGKSAPAPVFKIDSLDVSNQQAQVVTQQRSIVNYNIASNQALREQSDTSPSDYAQAPEPVGLSGVQVEQRAEQAQAPANRGVWDEVLASMQTVQEDRDTESVSIRIEPFVPIQVAGTPTSLFGGSIYLVRHVQVDGRHLLQGFQLQEERLLELIRRSAERYTNAEEMTYRLSRNGSDDNAYQRRLDFGFGGIVLSLLERNPLRIQQRSQGLRVWYLGMLGVVAVAVGLGLIGLWRGALEQLTLARKKDDFISAVSHELRTPLTSIRMYAEMLERGWVPSPEKQQGYYGHIRQESERLSRLIENVLDFSRMQQGRKTYRFEMGDLNDCVQKVADGMGPYARECGFILQTELTPDLQGRFDRDAVTQIVVNLLDNAIKYARHATDKTIWLRTLSDAQHVLIEVEDRGPGIPDGQRRKIFEQFYRTEDESTRETQGTGLGLALVKRLAEAHHGFVRFRAAQPTGAVFRVALGRPG